MANYYTQCVFAIPCSKEQADWLINTHRAVHDAWEASTEAAADETAAKPTEPHLAAILDRLKGECPSISIAFKPEVLVGDQRVPALLLSDDGEGVNLDYAAQLARSFLEKFERDDIIEIKWAEICDRHRLDGFGGGVAVVSRDADKWVNVTSIADKLRAEIIAERAEKVHSPRRRKTPRGPEL